MGQRFADLKQENEDLRQALRGFVAKHHIVPGDLVVFLADQNPAPGHRGTRYEKSTLGMSFGLGYGCIESIRRLMTELAGGVVGVMASSREVIDVYNLNRDERARLKATIEAIDRGQAKPTFAPLKDPLPPMAEDPSINIGSGPVTKPAETDRCTECKRKLGSGHKLDCSEGRSGRSG